MVEKAEVVVMGEEGRGGEMVAAREVVVAREMAATREAGEVALAREAAAREAEVVTAKGEGQERGKEESLVAEQVVGHKEYPGHPWPQRSCQKS